MKKAKILICYNHKEDKLYKDIMRTWADNSDYEFVVDSRSETEPFDSSQAVALKNALTNKYLGVDSIVVIVGQAPQDEKWMKWEMDMIHKLKVPHAVVRVHTSFSIPDVLKKNGSIAKSFTPTAVFKAIDQSLNNKKKAPLGKI